MAGLETWGLKVRRVTILRSAEAHGFVRGMSRDADMRRGLTVQGVAQAKKVGRLFAEANFDLMLTSTAQRTFETGQTLLRQVTNKRHATRFYQLLELAYDGEETLEGRILADIFQRVNGKSLKEHDAHDVGIIEERSALAWNKVKDIILQHNATRTIVIGHYPFIAGIGYIATGNFKGFDRNKAFAERYYGHCQGFTLTFVEGSVSKVELHL